MAVVYTGALIVHDGAIECNITHFFSCVVEASSMLSVFNSSC